MPLFPASTSSSTSSSRPTGRIAVLDDIPSKDQSNACDATISPSSIATPWQAKGQQSFEKGKQPYYSLYNPPRNAPSHSRTHGSRLHKLQVAMFITFKSSNGRKKSAGAAMEQVAARNARSSTSANAPVPAPAAAPVATTQPSASPSDRSDSPATHPLRRPRPASRPPCIACHSKKVRTICSDAKIPHSST